MTLVKSTVQSLQVLSVNLRGTDRDKVYLCLQREKDVSVRQRGRERRERMRE